jgi:hypothetical protein
MFVAFKPLHIFLCDAVLPYYVWGIEAIRSLILNLNQEGFEFT